MIKTYILQEVLMILNITHLVIELKNTRQKLIELQRKINPQL